MGKATFTPAQNAFRFYENGTETGSVAIANQDTNITRNLDSSSLLLLRIRIQEVGGASGGVNDDWQLQFSKNSGAYQDVNGTNGLSGNNSFDLTEGDPTTNRLGAGSGSFVAGEIAETTTAVINHQLTASNFTEHLWSLIANSSQLNNGDTLDFRVLINGSTMTYNVTPRITVSKTPPIVPQDETISLTLDTTTITQNHVVASIDSAIALTIDNTTINQNHALTAQDIALGITTDNTTVEEVTTIVPQDIALSLTENNTTISQNHILVVQDIALSLSEDNATITQNHVIASQDTLLSLSEDNTAITQIHIIVVQDLAVGSGADNGSLSQNHILVINDLLLSSQIDATTIEETAETVIAPNDISLSLSEDSNTLTQNHILTTDDLLLSMLIIEAALGQTDDGSPYKVKLPPRHLGFSRPVQPPRQTGFSLPIAPIRRTRPPRSY
jgi:hypothetical protein